MTVLDRFALAGKVVIVTGGAGLYGRPFVQGLAEAGADVVLTSRSAQTAKAVAAELEPRQGTIIGMQLDQGDPDSIAAFGKAVVQRCGHIDVLVNNAVHRQGGGLFETTALDWDTTSAVNSRGLFLLTQNICSTMVAQGTAGAVINIGSIYGIVSPDFPVYEGTAMVSPLFYNYDKAGMIGFTRYLAGALGPYGIRANCLCPGGLRSDAPNPIFEANYSIRTPLRRLAAADDVTPALVFLASDAARYITGVILPVDGGWTSH